MNKKQYQQPAVQLAMPLTEMPIAQINVGSQEHEDQWTKERDADFDYDPTFEEQGGRYGNLW